MKIKVLQTMRLESGSWIAPNQPYIEMMSSSIFFDVVLFLLSRLVTGQNFKSVSSLVLEMWQFLFIRD